MDDTWNWKRHALQPASYDGKCQALLCLDDETLLEAALAAAAGETGNDDASLFVNPMKYMESGILGVMQGKLYCPKCAPTLLSSAFDHISKCLNFTVAHDRCSDELRERMAWRNKTILTACIGGICQQAQLRLANELQVQCATGVIQLGRDEEQQRCTCGACIPATPVAHGQDGPTQCGCIGQVFWI